LIKAIDYSESVKLKDQNPKEISFLKYQLWVLMTINNEAKSSGDIKNLVQITNEEITQSLFNLEREILKEKISDKNIFLLIKASYELGFYNYIENNFEKMKIFKDILAVCLSCQLCSVNRTI